MKQSSAPLYGKELAEVAAAFAYDTTNLPLEVLWGHSRGKPQDAENVRRGFNSSLLLLEDLVIPEGENEGFLGRRY